MSLSRALPGDTQQNPLVVDENGHWVQPGPGDAWQNPLVVDENGRVVERGQLLVGRAL